MLKRIFLLLALLSCILVGVSFDQDKMVTTASGLKYIDLKVGTGEEAQNGTTVSVHYTGWLYENGKRGAKFDSSVDRGQPYELTLPGRVIKGWNEGLIGMKVGGKRELIIPPDLAYGANPRGSIPANSTLNFEIELLKVTK